MNKKTKKTEIMIDGVLYKQVQWSNSQDTNWKNIPQNPKGIIGSGLHTVKENRHRSHWEKYDGNQEIEGSKEYIKEHLRLPPIVLIDFKSHGLFVPPPDNQIIVLRGSDKPTEFISLEYYKKNKEDYLKKYSIMLGDEDNPQVLELKR